MNQHFEKGHYHTTWAKTFSCVPEKYFQPQSVEEVQDLVKHAKQNAQTLMTVGSGHSPSDLTMTDSNLVNLDKLNRILKISRDGSGNFADVEVEAGIRVFELNEALDKEKLAFQNLGSITDQSIAGLISTGSHGSTAFQGILSRQIVSLTLVDGEGNLVECSSEKNPRVFKAALLSLGKIGIIVKAVLRVVPSFRVKSVEQVIDFDELTDPKVWSTLWTSSEFIRVWWYPYVGKCVLWRGCKTTEQAEEDKVELGGSGVWGKVWKFVYQSMLFVSSKFVPSLTPVVSNWAFNVLYSQLEKKRRKVTVQKSFDAFYLDCLYSQYVNEWAVPMDDGLESLRQLAREFNEAKRKGVYYINDPVEVRCSNCTLQPKSRAEFAEYVSQRKQVDIGAIAGNEVRPYLETSADHGVFDLDAKLSNGPESCPLTTDGIIQVPQTNVTNSQLTLYLNLVMYRPFGIAAPFGKFFKRFEEILIPLGGKPHWAKNFIGDVKYVPQAKDEKFEDGDMIGFGSLTQKWFGEGLDEYKKVREQLDPHGVYLSGKDWAVRNGLVD